MEGQRHCHLPLCAGLSLFVFFRYYLVHIVCEMDEGEGGEEIWPGSLTYSSFLLLWSVGSINILGKVWHDERIWKVYLGWRWVERGGSWFKVSDRQRGCCRELFPAKSCLHKLFISLEICLQFNWLEMFKNCHCIIFVCFFLHLWKCIVLSCCMWESCGIDLGWLFVPSVGSFLPWMLGGMTEMLNAENPMSAFQVFSICWQSWGLMEEAG